MTAVDVTARINAIADECRALRRQLGEARDYIERDELKDQLAELEAESERLQAERRKLNAAVSPAAVPDQKPIIRRSPAEPAPRDTYMPNFIVYERFARNSVQAEPEPAVSLTASTLSFNQLALDAMGLKPGDRVALLFEHELGRIALQKPPQGWSLNRSSKLAKGSGAAPAVITSLAGFTKWARINAQKARGIYQPVYDPDAKHWSFQLPDGSWTKPAHSTPASVAGAGSTIRGNGLTSAQKREDLPATSPHRRAAS